MNQLESKYQEGSFEDYEEEFLPYLNRFSDDKIFPDPDRLDAVLKTDNADVQALDLAIEAEEKFAEYFAKASHLARSDDGRDAFAWLADEEARHAAILQKRRAAYAAG